mgnify:CR=1 FL=1
MKVVFYPGDFVICKNQTWFLSNAIAALTREPNERGYSHSLVVVGEGGMEVDIIQAVFPRVERITMIKALHTAKYAVCLRPYSATKEQRCKIVTTALEQENALYGLHRLPKLALGLFLKSEEIQELELSPRLPPTCSSLCGLCLQAAGLSWGEEPASLMAAEMLIYARAHPEMWEIFEVPC